MPESNPPVLTPNRNRAVQSKTFSTPTPVAVEKVHFPENGRNLGDRKCLGKPRKSFAGLPSAKFFRPVLRDRVFQHPRLLTALDHGERRLPFSRNRQTYVQRIRIRSTLFLSTFLRRRTDRSFAYTSPPNS